MNINPETDLDLEKLFLPAWAQESSSTNRYAKFTGGETSERGERRGPRPFRGEGEGAKSARGRRDERPRGPRRADSGARPAPENRGEPRRDDRRDFRERREPPPPLPEVNVTLVPDEKGVESLSRQVKMTGRAYPLFDIARLILQKPERYAVRFAVKKNAEGQIAQPLFICALDETVWLTEDEAVAHVLRQHFATFYQAERTATEPPKGKYTFVGQCGISGIVLGPPNYHDYQTQLHKLHSERFAKMPFEVYKSRVKIVRDEEVVKKWVEEQSWKTEYVCLNVPEPLKLATRSDVEQHFRATHKDTIIKPVETHTVSGGAVRGIRCHGLAQLARQVCEDQRHFPLQIATVLSQQFASHGLQFFKVNKTVTHVCVARPHFLDLETTPVSEGVKRIVEFINAHPKCTRRKLVEALAPSPAPAPIPVAPVEGQTATATPAASEPTADQTALIGDLHWLVHQGHVIEFANGTLDTAKKPAFKPPKPEKKRVETATAAAADTSGETTSGFVQNMVAETPVKSAPVEPEAALPSEAELANEASSQPIEAEEPTSQTANEVPVEKLAASTESQS